MWATLAVVLILQAPAARAPLSPDLKRAQQHGTRGWTKVDARDYTGAVRDFEAALQIYAEYADALHGLGKARMALKDYEGAARALEGARDSYSRSGTQAAEYRLLANRAKDDQLRLLRQRLADLENASGSNSGAANLGTTELLNLKQQIRDLQGDRDAGPSTGEPRAIPPFISLALGSAYFRLDRLDDAERQFRAAIAVDPKFGEAHSNLALVCLLTGRPKDAQTHVQIAEEARFKVNPELKRQIREALQIRHP